MKIQVFGTGCASCKQLHERTVQAAEELALDTEVEYITDIEQMLELGVMQSPVLAIDGVPVAVGSIPNPFRIKELLSETLQNKKEPAASDGECGSCSCGGNC